MMRYLLILAGVWLAWTALAFVLQRRFLYPGAYMERARARPVAEVPGVERIWLAHGEGRAEAWLLPAAGADDGPGPAVVFFHGNGEFIDDWPEVLRPFADRLGLTLLLVEYPGYGRSTGTPSYAGIMEVATSAWDTLAARPEVDPQRMVAMGRSLGGGPAAELARVRQPAALILQSTFTDVGVMAARHSWIPPAVIRDRWRPVDGVRAFGGPVLLLHGRRDRIVPFRHGVELAAARDGIDFHPLPCGHNDCPPPGEAWWGVVEAFLEEAGVVKGR